MKERETNSENGRQLKNVVPGGSTTMLKWVAPTMSTRTADWTQLFKKKDTRGGGRYRS